LQIRQGIDGGLFSKNAKIEPLKLSFAQRRLHAGELGTERESGSTRERESKRAVQLDSGVGVQIRRTVGLNNKDADSDLHRIQKHASHQQFTGKKAREKPKMKEK